MRVKWRLYVWAIFFVLLQVVIGPYLGMFKVLPDFILIWVVVLGLTEGPEMGAKVGFWSGLLGDIFMGGHMGIGAFTKVVVGYLAGLVRMTVFFENIFLAIVVVLAATLLNDLVYVLFMFLLGEIISLKLLLFKITFGSAIYNALVTPIVFYFKMKLISGREELSSIA
jgi:rod shape-determining protein MreD